MIDYKSLFYKSQAEIANTIESLEQITYRLKKCMYESEKSILSDERNIIIINKNEEK